MLVTIAIVQVKMVKVKITIESIEIMTTAKIVNNI